MAKRKPKGNPKRGLRRPNPLNRCPDCNARPQGHAICHENSCPHYHALEERKRADERWLRDHPRGMFLERPITSAESDELRWTRPAGVDLEPMPDLVRVSSTAGHRVRAFYNSQTSGADL